jgi:carbonic anhydrase/acetyltransferase-like protein (isoleucine patch superfamily)
VGGNICGRKCERGWADIIGNVMLTTTSSLVQQVKIRATTASTDTISGRWWCLGAGIQGNVNVGGNAIILKYWSKRRCECGCMNVVGNADISGNVMLTTTSSLVQQVKIRATTESANTISGRWWCLVGREYKET